MPAFRATVMRVLQGHVFPQIGSTSLIVGYQYHHHRIVCASLEAITLELRSINAELKEMNEALKKISRVMEKSTKIIEKNIKMIENINVMIDHCPISREEHIEKHGKAVKEVARTIERPAAMNGVWDIQMTKPMREIQTEHPVLVALEATEHYWKGFRRENRTSLLVDREMKV